MCNLLYLSCIFLYNSISIYASDGTPARIRESPEGEGGIAHVIEQKRELKATSPTSPVGCEWLTDHRYRIGTRVALSLPAELDTNNKARARTTNLYGSSPFFRGFSFVAERLFSFSYSIPLPYLFFLKEIPWFILGRSTVHSPKFYSKVQKKIKITGWSNWLDYYLKQHYYATKRDKLETASAWKDGLQTAVSLHSTPLSSFFWDLHSRVDGLLSFRA